MIPNLNGRHLLEKNLPYLTRALKKARVPSEIIVCDDNSSDDSVAFLRQNYQSITVVQGRSQLGFAGNINRGIFKARKPLLLTLNTDVSIDENYFFHVFEAFDEFGVFSVSGLFFDPDSNPLPDSKQALKLYPHVIRSLAQSTDCAGPNLYSCAACALFDRQKLLDLGGFSTVYDPFYGEDLDLALRAWQTGFKVIFEPRATCIHQVAVTVEREFTQKQRTIIGRRNKFITPFLHYRRLRRIGWWLAVFLNLALRFLIFDKTYYTGFSAFWRHLPVLKREQTRWWHQLRKARGLTLLNLQRLLQNRPG